MYFISFKLMGIVELPVLPVAVFILSELHAVKLNAARKDITHNLNDFITINVLSK
jgi:hypothetical protein